MKTERSDQEPDRPSRPIVITVNTRLARVLRRRHDRQQTAMGTAVWVSPDTMPLRAWLERCWREWLFSGASPEPVQLLRASQERTIWEDIVARSGEGAGLLQVTTTSDAALEAWNLVHAWHVPLESPEWENSSDSEAFRGWAQEFQRRCDTGNRLSGARLMGFVRDRMEMGEIPVPPILMLAGFNEFTPAEELLLQTLRDKGCAVEALQREEKREKASATRIGFIDAETEFRAAARWARRSIEASRPVLEPGKEPGKDEEHQVGIIVPELSKYRSQIERLFAEELHPNGQLSPDRDSRRAFNISLGPGLAEYPLIQAAFLVLHAELNLEKRVVMSLESAGRLLRSPFIDGAQSEITARALLDARLRRRREPEVAVSDIVSLARSQTSGRACPVLVKCLTRWEREYSTTRSRRLPGDWAVIFSNLLHAAGWPGSRPLSSAEFQIVAAWNELLSEFSGLDSVAGEMYFSIARSMLQRLAASRQFQPESETAPVQVLGVFEASGLDFERLWITGMHDGAWPRSVGPNPFIPLRLQREGNLPQSSAERELEFTKLLTAQLLACSPHIVLSHPQRDGDSDLRPSPLLPDIPESSAETLGLSGGPRYPELLRKSGRFETMDDHYAPAWDGSFHRGGTAIFAHQAACPFRAFAKVRLAADTLESLPHGLSPLDRGNLTHRVFQRVWNRLRSHETLISAPPERLGALVRDEVAASIDEMSPERLVLRRPRFAAIERARLERLTREWLELEKKRRPFTVVEQEQDRKVTVGGIEVTIRADRIDQLDDGTRVLVDYKTSVHAPKEWKGPRPDEPQLPLYSITSDFSLSGVFFGVAKLGKTQFTGLAISDGIVPNVRLRPKDLTLQEHIENWRRDLASLAKDFREGRAFVDPKIPAQTCRHCGLHGLCRVSKSNEPVDNFSENTDID